jgi:hypothetical protein
MVTVQGRLRIISMLAVIMKGGYTIDINVLIITDQSRLILDIAKAVRIRLTEDIFLLLTQSV